MLADRRPEAVRNAIDDHRGDALNFGPRSGLAPMRWERDAAANYGFGRFGSGRDAVTAACAHAQDEGRQQVSICDIGCGSGGFLSIVASQAATEAGLVLTARGLTGGRESCAVEHATPCNVAECDGDWRDQSSAVRCTGSVDEKRAHDILLLQRFPIEDVLSCGAADFVQQGQTFDLIVCSWTLRHCADPLGTLEQLANLLRVGGVILANQLWLPFAGESGRWDDEPALRRGIAALNSGATGVSLELDAAKGATDTVDEDECEASEAIWTAVRCVRTGATPVRFAMVEFTGEVSGPMSLDATKSVCCLSGGPSYAMARYALQL